MPDYIPILSEDTLVTSADTDFTRTLKPGALVNFHIQVAWHHAQNLGFGIDFLHENALVWMLSRMHIKIYCYPHWDEYIKLQSWPKGIRRLFYLRDFRFFDQQNNIISEATSEWLIINLASRRPKLYNPDHNIFQENTGKHALEGEVPVLSTPMSEADIFANKVVYSDVDLNQHLTTTRYVDWMFDCFDLDFLKQNPYSELVLNFIKEIPYGSKVEIRRFSPVNDSNYYFEFIGPENNLVFFRGMAGFSKTGSNNS
jgi:medium-chain acyl-[acyl-carrier-protein] hydrolase